MPSPRTHGKTNKREAILNAAVDLLFANGYERTSMDAVAAAAGVSKTTVYAHFADKLELFKAVMRHAGDEFTLDIGGSLADLADAAPEEQLVATLIHAITAGTTSQFLAYFRILITETDRRKTLTDSFFEVQTSLPDLVVLLARLIEADAEANEYTVANAVALAEVLLRATVPTFQLDMLMSNFRPTPETIEVHVRFVVAVFLRGIRPRDGATAALERPDYDFPWGPALHHR